MTPLALMRWMALRLLGSPLAWGLALGFLLGPALSTAIRPTPGAPETRALLLTWVHPAGLLGSCLGLTTLARGRDVLRCVADAPRWAGELAALVVATAYLQLPALIGVLLSGAAPSDLCSSLPAILSADLHLSSLALVILVPPIPTAAAVGSFLALVWALPALLVDGLLAARLRPMLDPAWNLRAHAAPASLAAAASLGLAAYLLRTSRARQAVR